MEDVETIKVNPDRVFTIGQTAELIGVSVDTLKRGWTKGIGPKKTQLSTRRVGVRARHIQEYLDGRVKP